MSQQETPYYVKDFLHVIETITVQYGNELSEAEQAFLKKLDYLSMPALCLYVRLLNRSKPYYRVSKLKYPECHVISDHLEELASHRLTHSLGADAEAAHHHLADCYTVRELGLLLKGKAATGCKTKGDYLDFLERWEQRQSWLPSALEQDPLITPEREPWQFIAYLYFGQLTPNLSAFVVKELGHITPETVEPLAFERIFKSREHGEITYQHTRLYYEFKAIQSSMSGLEKYQWWKAARLLIPIDETTSESHDRLVRKIGECLQKSNCLDLAITVYRQCISETCAMSLAKLLRKRGDRAEALEICRDRSTYSADPDVVQQAELLIQRLQGKKARSQMHRVLNVEPIIRINDQGRGVEHSALAHLAKDGWVGIHSENWLWSALFGLALWDIIYDPGFGGFHNSLQLAPADMWRPEFHFKRASAIDARIKAINSADDLLTRLITTLGSKKDVSNPFFNWHENLETCLGELCSRAPLSGLKAVLRRMANDPGMNLRGFPDLFVWQDGSYRFIEVKSLNDKLSSYQLAWLNSLKAFGIEASVMRVHLTESKEQQMAI